MVRGLAQPAGGNGDTEGHWAGATAAPGGSDQSDHLLAVIVLLCWGHYPSVQG